MNFYISFILFNIVMCVFSKNIVTKSGLDHIVPCSVGLKFFAEINNTSGDDCVVEIHPDECCLESNDAKCNIIEVIGSATESIPEGTSKTLHLIAPLLDPYDRKGFCTIYVDYKSRKKPKNFIRDTIKIKFDTTLHKSKLPEEAKLCNHVDEDPLNDCKPVNCDTHYNNQRSFYNIIKKRCTNVPVCVSNTKTEIPKVAYNPVSNKCVSKPAISKDDIEFIKVLTRDKNRKAKDILIIKMTDKNLTAPAAEVADYDYNTIARIEDPDVSTEQTVKKEPRVAGTHKIPSTLDCILEYMTKHKYTLMVLSAIVLLQCCLIFTLIYYLTVNCGCRKNKKVENKYFNYRHDASVTTPLICTSNIDTETTDYQYLSESSNYIDKKIKCYKACQKERKNNVKLSMSDDILSKCLTRRDWHRLPRSDTIPEVKTDEVPKGIDRKDLNLDSRKSTETKVNFQEETLDKRSRSVKSNIKKGDNKMNNQDDLSDSSEKIIRCHSFNYDVGSNLIGYEKRGNKRFGIYKSEKKGDSIEQAQAYFSNDSIEDFVSERGGIFIGDNASKYSFSSSSSAGKSSATSQSSKTSKNNVVKNVLSMLSRKVKGPSSDPGVNKTKPDLDLELLHISRPFDFKDGVLYET
ncbi:hypothetical protein HF086_014606 [Spodoptera exigua]|uniref:Uncharacterized protein n=1 Tax=Spodoptera exigua TaxID=7107 RepID=A0A922M672_SPOEX|nr:hypothetical protein HF086_014606 [Spodoptera exigua]